MRSFVSRLRFRRVERRGILVESLLFVSVYILLLVLLSQYAFARGVLESLAVMVSAMTGALLIVLSMEEIKLSARSAWFLLAGALVTWTFVAMLKFFFLLLLDTPQFFHPLVSSFHLVAALLVAIGLMRYPSQGRYAAPTQFRFVLDVLISSVAVVVLGWLLMTPPVTSSLRAQFSWMIILSAPIADLVLLVILFNVSLTSQMSRLTTSFFGAGLVAFALSDYAASALTLLDSFTPGSLVSLGWVIGALLLGMGAVYEKSSGGEKVLINGQPETGIEHQFQQVLPIALVLVLFWFVFTDWRLRGTFNTWGVWMSIALGLMLIIRLGIRAGEAELNTYWQLFKSLADPAFICGREGNIVLSNPAFAQLSPDSDSELSIFSIFPDLSQDSLKDFPEEHGKALEVEAQVYERRIPYRVSLSPIATDGRQALFAGVAHNLTEQKRQRETIQSAFDELQSMHHRLEELNVSLEKKVEDRTATLQDAYTRLEEQNKLLQELDQLKSDFVSMVSHELRTPLNNLGGGLELLLARQRKGGTGEDTLELMQAEIRRLTLFVENILDVSAIEAGRMLPQNEPLSMNQVFEEVRSNWGAQHEVQRIEYRVPARLPKVMADRSALESVLNHLLDNAIKYAPEGSICVSARRVKQVVRVEVRDSGPGIPEDKQNLLFERFQRLDVKDSQSVYGYGLGLYLSKRLLQAMGSELSFEAPPDGGACFSFSLKVAKK